MIAHFLVYCKIAQTPLKEVITLMHNKGVVVFYRKGKRMKSNAYSFKKTLQSLAIGASSAFDLFPRPSKTIAHILSKSDSEALTADWYTLGEDIRDAIATFERDNERQLANATSAG